MDNIIIGALTIIVATTAALAAAINSKNSGRSAKAAINTYDNKYTPKVKHKISTSKFCQQKNTHLVTVEFTNLSEIPVHIIATIKGRVQRYRSKDMYYDVHQDNESTVKSGERSSTTFELFTQNDWRGKACLFLSYKLTSTGTEVEINNIQIPPFNL